MKRANRWIACSAEPSGEGSRDRIERMIGYPKRFRRLATCYDKTAAAFLSFMQLAAIHR